MERSLLEIADLRPVILETKKGRERINLVPILSICSCLIKHDIIVRWCGCVYSFASAIGVRVVTRES